MITQWTIYLVIAHEPVTKGSFVHGRRGTFYVGSGKIKSFEAAVLAAVREHPAQQLDVGCAVCIDYIFRFARPKSHFRADGTVLAHKVKAIPRKDLDKLERCVNDALVKACVIKDDNLIVQSCARKLYLGCKQDKSSVAVCIYPA